MKKKGKKSKQEKHSFDERSDAGGDNIDSTVKRNGAGSKTRLRRRREGSYIHSESDSNVSDAGGDRKQRKRRKRRKRSRATTVTTEESSEWEDGSHIRPGSKITTEEEKSKQKGKEITEADLVEKMKEMVPYVKSDSPLWTKWTLAPLYHFIRNPDATLVVAITVPSSLAEENLNKLPTTIQRLLKLYRTENAFSKDSLILITFNELIKEYTGEFFYFIKIQPVKINAENFVEAMSYGNVPSGQVQSFSSLLSYVWTPIFYEEDCLPDGIKNEVFTDLNTLSCVSHSADHLLATEKMLLYIPLESFSDKTEDELSNDKEFCSRLEETVVYWLTKLKEMLLLKEVGDEHGSQDPLEEIRFWRNRNQNLAQILNQMRNPSIKKLIQILIISRSPFVLKLRSILTELQDAHREASSNAHFLQGLRQPCAALATSKLRDIKSHIQKFLWLTLMLQRNAPFYNSPKCLNNLLRKFSNVLVQLCRKRIKLGSILQGKLIYSSERVIKNCVQCLSWWKQVYASTEKTFSEKEPDTDWIFDYDKVFVHVDAMLSRLNDLSEICTAQKLYGRIQNDIGDIAPLPLYPGIKGTRISCVMETTAERLQSTMSELLKVSDLVLNVQSTEWIGHMKVFQTDVLSIEMVIQNVLEEAFDPMSNLKQKLDLLHQFHQFYSRDIITRRIDKLAIQVYEYFEEEVLKLRKLFELKIVPLPNTYSQMAGRGAWAIYMKNRIEQLLNTLKKSDSWLPKSEYGDSVRSEAKSLADAMASYSLFTYEEWATSEEIVNEKDFRAKLDIPLLVRSSRETKDVLEINFDRNVFRILAEASIWERIGRPVPAALLTSIYNDHEKLQSLLENISIVAKCYNGVISVLSRDERLLFREKLLPLEKMIYPCLVHHTWASYAISDHTFVEEFEKFAREITENVRLYREGNSKISKIVQKMSSRLMMKIVPNKVYNPDEFSSMQNDLIASQLKKIVMEYKTIGKILQDLFTAFQDNGPEVKIQWGKYINLVDDCVEEALQISLQNSLRILDNLMCTGNKPVFHIEMKLEKRRISFHPTLENLAEMISGVQANIAKALEPLSKISGYVESISSPVRSFTAALLNDTASLEIQEKIEFSIKRCFSELNLYAERWTPYRDIWEVKKETFMENYERGFSSLTACEKDMAKYIEISQVVSGSEDFINVRFLQVDCTLLKSGISEESIGWVSLISETLSKGVTETLRSVYDFMESNKKIFLEEPQTTEEQIELLQLLENAKSESLQKSEMFPLISKQFEILKKFDFDIETNIYELNLKLEEEWRTFQQYLEKTDRKLQKSYEKLKSAIIDRFRNVRKKLDDLIKSYENDGPFSRDALMQKCQTTCENYCDVAVMSLENYLNDTKVLKAEDLAAISSLKFFNILKEPSKILANLESEIAGLSMVWGKVRIWEEYWTEWKFVQIENIPLNEMIISEFLAKFRQLEKKFEDKPWPVISEVTEFIQNVEDSLKTVPYLKGDTLKSRHLEKIKLMLSDSKLIPVGISRSGELSLESVVALKLYVYVGQLSEISMSSGMEKAIENTLRKIEEFWEDEMFILQPRKGLVPFEIQCRAVLQPELIDHIVSLSAMKGSPFIWPFQENIDHWAKLLSKVTDVLEKLITTQKEWSFLEKAFLNEDLQKDMPRQLKQFKIVSSLWASIVLVIMEERNVLKVVERTRNLTEMLEEIWEQMGIVIKNLQAFLQEQRQEFPRLYFVSDDDLLKCIGGNTKSPHEIFPLICRLFGNSFCLNVSKNKSSGVAELYGISGATGECLIFPQQVSISGPLANWLAELESWIQSSVHYNFQQCLISFQQNINQLGEWILATDSLRQNLLTVAHLQWTLDVTKAIYFESNFEDFTASSRENSSSAARSEITLKQISKRLRRNISHLQEILQERKRNGLSNLQKLKIEEVLVKLLYLREITEELRSCNSLDANSFEWLQQIRFYMGESEGGGGLVMKQGFSRIEYGFEYVGGDQKFVLTPLVNRCFLALTTAISYHYGGLIHGTSGVGKKEMIAQLGRLLGRHVVFVNLSKATQINHLSSIIIGVVQTGSWAILNNISDCEPHLIPLIMAKLALITKAKSEAMDLLMLDGIEARMERNCGVFAVMNSSLKDSSVTLSSLSAVLRPVAMVQPDIANILDVNLFIGGFEDSTDLAKKIKQLFATAANIIRYQNHCRFSLSSMLGVIKKATEFKSIYKKRLKDSEAIVKALRHIILPSLSPEETVVFQELVQDYFSYDVQTKMENQQLEESIMDSIKELGFQQSEGLVKYCLRLHDIMQLYKIVILVGNSGTGKSVIRKILKTSLRTYNSGQNSMELSSINEFLINPSTFQSSELFGYHNFETGRWKEGIFSKLLATKSESESEHEFQVNQSAKVKQKVWIVLDGPVERNFLEGRVQEMLTLNTDMTHFVVETENLSNASPSLIAQSGVIFIDDDLTTWKLSLRAWMNTYPVLMVKTNFSKYILTTVEKCLEFFSGCASHIHISPQTSIKMFTKLMDSFLNDLRDYKDEHQDNEEKLSMILQQTIAFSITWSMFGTLTKENQQKASTLLKDITDSKVFPTKGTVFDYFIDFRTQKWLNWNILVGEPNLSPCVNENRYIEPTDDTQRVEYLLSRFVQYSPTMVVGYSNSGKTSLMKSTLNSAQSSGKKTTSIHIQMTPMMQGKSLQSLIKSRLEPVSPFVLAPSRGRRLTVFIDDLHAFCGSQSAKLLEPKETVTSSYCEFLRSLIENEVWYDRDSGLLTAVSNLSIVSAMTLSKRKTACGIPTRLQTKFSMVYVPPPNEFQLRRIFTTKLTRKLHDFTPSVKLLGDAITVATLDAYKAISTQLLPVPSKPFHIFGIHDLSRLYEGLMRSHKTIQDTKHGLLRLWLHELFRVFHDRLMDTSSRQLCRNILAGQLHKHFDISVDSLFTQGGKISMFGSFMSPSSTKQVYEEMKNEGDFRKLLLKVISRIQKEDVKADTTCVILFKAAIEQVAKIARVLSTPCGHLINSSNGGQGRQTLTRLAARLLNYEMIEISQPPYYWHPNGNPDGSANFVLALKEITRDAYNKCILKNQNCCLMLTDEHISADSLEIISLITSTVEIPDLYTKKEVQCFQEKVELDKRAWERKLGNNFDFLDFMKERVKQNLHAVLCLNPSTDRLRRLFAKYPPIIKQFNINWMHIWTRESFLEVVKFLVPANPDLKVNLDNPIHSGSIFSVFHSIADQESQTAMKYGLLKFSTIAASHFLHFSKLYVSLVDEMTLASMEKIQALQQAMKKVAGVKARIGSLSEQATVGNNKVEASRNECNKLREMLEKQESETNMQTDMVSKSSDQLDEEVKEFEELAEVIKTEWTEALTEFEETNLLVQDLAEEDLTHIRSYYSPPPLVSRVLDSVMIMLDRNQTWPEARIQIGHPDFIRKIIDYDKGTISMEKLESLRKFTQNPEFTPEAVSKYSNGARILCAWIHAICNYGRIYLTRILPKREKLEEAEQSIMEKRRVLDLATQKLQLLNENFTDLKSNYATKCQLKEEYEKDANHRNALLERASSVLELLKDDEVQWEMEVGRLEIKLKNVSGDCLLLSASLAYLGPFAYKSRRIIRNQWLDELYSRSISTSIKFGSEWNIAELVTSLSTQIPILDDLEDLILENIIILKNCKRKLLIVDPYEVAADRIKLAYFNLVRDQKDKTNAPEIIPMRGSWTLSNFQSLTRNRLENMEECRKLLITNKHNPELGWEITSKFYILNFSISEEGLKNQLSSKMAELLLPEVESSRQFLQHKLVEEKTILVDIEENIPRLVISHGETMLDNGDFPETLAELKNDLMLAQESQKQVSSELLELNNKKQQILPLVGKMCSIYMALCELFQCHPMYEMSLKFFAKSIRKVLTKFLMRASSPDADRASPRNKLDGMLEFMSGPGCKLLLRELTQTIFACDRYLFALLLFIQFTCDNNAESRSELQELTYLSRIGKLVCIHKPVEDTVNFPTPEQLEKLKKLDELKGFKGILSSINELDAPAWRIWMTYQEPENKFPGQAASAFTPFQKLILLFILRPERVLLQVKTLVDETLGDDFGEILFSPNLVDLKEIHADVIATGSSNDDHVSPVIFLLSNNSSRSLALDVQESIESLASSSKPLKKLYSLPVSSGNIHMARKILKDGLKQGFWVYFSNCHIAPEWMVELADVLGKVDRSMFHESFRLWMSIEVQANANLPTELLRNSTKIVVEHPQNLQSGISRLLRKTSSPTSSAGTLRPTRSAKLERLLYGLTYFHCNLGGKSKFDQFTLPEQANQSTFHDIDFEISSAILKTFDETYPSEQMPWWALKQMLELQYSNHFSSVCTLEQHQSFVRALLSRIFCEAIVSGTEFRLSASRGSHSLLGMPANGNGDLTSYHNFNIANYTNLTRSREEDNPEAYGLHESVGVLRNTHQAANLLQSLQQVLTRIVNKMKYQSQQTNSNSQSESTQGQQEYDDDGKLGMEDDKIPTGISKLLDSLPEPVDKSDMLEMKLSLMRQDFGEAGEHYQSQALHYVMLMEIRHWNDLLAKLRGAMEDVMEVCRGQLPMTFDIMSYIDKGKGSIILLETSFPNIESWCRRVPQPHNSISPTKYLRQMRLGDYFHPVAILTSILRKNAKTRGIPMINLCWKIRPCEEFIMEGEGTMLQGSSKSMDEGSDSEDGANLNGLFLVGAEWDAKEMCLRDLSDGRTYFEMKNVRLVPEINPDISDTEKFYSVPCYHNHQCVPFMGPETSRIFSVITKSGECGNDRWILGQVHLVAKGGS